MSHMRVRSCWLKSVGLVQNEMASDSGGLTNPVFRLGSAGFASGLQLNSVTFGVGLGLVS